MCVSIRRKKTLNTEVSTGTIRRLPHRSFLGLTSRLAVAENMQKERNALTNLLPLDIHRASPTAKFNSAGLHPLLLLQSMYFLIAASEYREDIDLGDTLGSGGIQSTRYTKKGRLGKDKDDNDDGGFQRLIAIVNEYIRPSSPSEVNIHSATRTRILKYAQPDAFDELDPVR